MHLDFDTETKNDDKIIYTNKKDNGNKIIILYQISYVSKDLAENQEVKRPYSLTVTKNNNKVITIQTIKEENQRFEPTIEIRKNDKISIEIEGYDGTALIYLFGVVAEPIGTNIS